MSVYVYLFYVFFYLSLILISLNNKKNIYYFFSGLFICIDNIAFSIVLNKNTIYINITILIYF